MNGKHQDNKGLTLSAASKEYGVDLLSGKESFPVLRDELRSLRETRMIEE